MNICFNGDFLEANQPILTVQNRGFKWGDGLFETMKFYHDRLLLSGLHFERLFLSTRLLQMETATGFTSEYLLQLITALCEKNHCSNNARVRLSVYRTDTNQTGFSMEALPLEEACNEWQSSGISLGIYPYARKSMDAFANIKSANFLPYILAQKYAAEQQFDDAIVLNAQNFLCDTSKANIFLVKNKQLYTPALHQGCINGVMRKVVIEEARKAGIRVNQDEVSEEDLLQADEVFLTNAIQIIRWVETYKNKTYSSTFTQEIFHTVSEMIFR